MSPENAHTSVECSTPSKRLSRRSVLRGAAAAAVAPAVATALGQKATSAAPVPAIPSLSAPKASAVELKLNARTGGEQTIFEGLIAQFQEANPDIKITGQFFTPDNQEYFQKVAILIAGGTAGDLIWMSSIEGFYDYASRGTWKAVDEYIARDAVDLGQWYPAAVQMMKVGEETFGLPLWSHPSIVGLFYNKDLFDAAGVGVPDATWTTDNLSEAAAKLTKRSGDTAETLGYAPATGYFNGLCQVIPSFGGQSLSPDGKTMTFDSPEATAAIQWLVDQFVTNKVTPTAGGTYGADTDTFMNSSKLAMRANGYWGNWGANAWTFNWGVAPISKGPAGTTGAMLQTDAMVINKRTKHADEAWLFHKFLSTKEAGMYLWQQHYLPGSRPDVWEDPALTADATHAVFAEQMKVATPLVYPANFRFRELETAINQEMSNAWSGKDDVAKVIENVTKTAQAILDKGPA